jgi:hypothetical protein
MSLLSKEAWQKFLLLLLIRVILLCLVLLLLLVGMRVRV